MRSPALKTNRLESYGAGYTIINQGSGGSGGSGSGGAPDEVLGSYTAGAGVVSGADTIKQAIQKIDGNVTVISATLQDKLFTQPSSSTSWTIVHSRPIKTNFAFYNAAGFREYPIEDHSVVGQVSLTFATSEIHTAILPGNGTSATLRNEAVLSLNASAVNAASGVIDIVTARTVVITMDVALTFAVTFTGIPADETQLRLKYIKGVTPFAALAPDTNKFGDTQSSVHQNPLLLATANTEDRYDYAYSAAKGKMMLLGFVMGG